MQKRKTQLSGLWFRNGSWYIDKRINGRRISESTQTSDRQEAERYLARRLEEIRQATVYGVRPERIFRQAATHYLNQFSHKSSIGRDAQDLTIADPFIGDLPLRQVHNGTLQRFINTRKGQGVKSSTVSRTLAVVRRVLNLCAREWRDEHGLSWLETPPIISLVNWKDARKPYPINWQEQSRLFDQLAPHLRESATFAVNTGLREQEICGLRWEWEVPLPEIKTSVFVLPGEETKNGRDRIVPLNSAAMAVINRQRGKHSTKVFTYEGRPVKSCNNNGWQRARKAAGLSQVRFHDLRHTVGRRLRAAGVSQETRADILGHDRGEMTTHYSMVEVKELIDAVELIASEPKSTSPSLRVIRSGLASHQSPTKAKREIVRNQVND